MNIVDLNLDMINLVKDIGEDCAVFYFLVGSEEERDFLYAKGDLDIMAEALAGLMRENEQIEQMVRHAITEFQDEEDTDITDAAL